MSVNCQSAVSDSPAISTTRFRAYATGGRPIPKVVALAAWALSMQPRVAEARKLLAG